MLKFFKNIKFSEYTIFILVVFVFILSFNLFVCNKSNVSYSFMTEDEKHQNLITSWKHFISLSPENLHCLWEQKFVKAIYKFKEGNILLNQYNCSTGFIDFLRDFGSVSVMENSISIGKRLKKYSEINLTEKRKRLKDVETSDIIIFTKNSRGIAHIGLVERVTTKNKLVYMDINGTDNIGFKYIKWGNYKIKGVYSLSFAFWCGDFFKKKNFQ